MWIKLVSWQCLAKLVWFALAVSYLLWQCTVLYISESPTALWGVFSDFMCCSVVVELRDAVFYTGLFAKLSSHLLLLIFFLLIYSSAAIRSFYTGVQNCYTDWGSRLILLPFVFWVCLALLHKKTLFMQVFPVLYIYYYIYWMQYIGRVTNRPLFLHLVTCKNLYDMFYFTIH